MKNQIAADARRALLHASRGISPQFSLNDIRLKRDFELLTKDEKIIARKGNDNAPVLLYKYYPPTFKMTGESSFDVQWRAEQNKRLENLIINGMLYLSSRDQFNDPFDTLPRYTTTPMLSTLSEIADRSIKKYGAHVTYKQKKEILKNLIKNSEIIFNNLISAYRIHHSNIGIYCLTEFNNSLLMWAHYAVNHTGVCIEFDTSEDYWLTALLQKVIYTPENTRPTINLTEPNFSSTYIETFLTKSIHWNYEAEWRLIYQDLAKQEIRIKQSTITKIIIGAKAHQETINDILAINEKLKDKKLRPLEIQQAQMCEMTYDLRITPLKN